MTTLSRGEAEYFWSLSHGLENIVDAFAYGELDNEELRDRANRLRWDLVDWIIENSKEGDDDEPT